MPQRSGLDDHGQPLNPHFYNSRITDRQIHEMLGMVKGLISDGVLNDAEIQALRQWLRGNPDSAVVWPGKPLAERTVRIFEDGQVDEAERRALHELMEQTIGGPEAGDADVNLSSQLPLTQPPPTILFDGREFVFTGHFVYGTRQRCMVAVSERGGSCHDSVTKATGYLVVGTIGSIAWTQSTHGRKIERAVRLREQGVPIGIISEAAWHAALTA